MAVMASARVAKEVILTPERTLAREWLDGECLTMERVDGVDSLRFKLVWQDQVCMVDGLLVGRNDVVIDIQPTLIAHHRIKN